MINSDVNKSYNSQQTYSQDQINQKKEKINVVFADKCTENELECTVCFEPIKDATTLKCLHVFCKFCLEQTLAKQYPCPECRDPFIAQDMKHDFRTQKIIDRLWAETCKNEGLENEPNPYKHVETANSQKVLESPKLPSQNNVQPQNPRPSIIINNSNNIIFGDGHVGPCIDQNGRVMQNQNFPSTQSTSVNFAEESVEQKIKSIAEQFEENKDKNHFLSQLVDLSNDYLQNETLNAIISAYLDDNDEIAVSNNNNSPKHEIKQSSKISNNMPPQVINQPSINQINPRTQIFQQVAENLAQRKPQAALQYAQQIQQQSQRQAQTLERIAQQQSSQMELQVEQQARHMEQQAQQMQLRSEQQARQMELHAQQMQLHSEQQARHMEQQARHMEQQAQRMQQSNIWMGK